MRMQSEPPRLSDPVKLPHAHFSGLASFRTSKIALLTAAGCVIWMSCVEFGIGLTTPRVDSADL